MDIYNLVFARVSGEQHCVKTSIEAPSSNNFPFQQHYRKFLHISQPSIHSKKVFPFSFYNIVYSGHPKAVYCSHSFKALLIQQQTQLNTCNELFVFRRAHFQDQHKFIYERVFCLL